MACQVAPCQTPICPILNFPSLGQTPKKSRLVQACHKLSSSCPKPVPVRDQSIDLKVDRVQIVRLLISSDKSFHRLNYSGRDSSGRDFYDRFPYVISTTVFRTWFLQSTARNLYDILFLIQWSSSVLDFFYPLSWTSMIFCPWFNNRISVIFMTWVHIAGCAEI